MKTLKRILIFLFVFSFLITSSLAETKEIFTEFNPVIKDTENVKLVNFAVKGDTIYANLSDSSVYKWEMGKDPVYCFQISASYKAGQEQSSNFANRLYVADDKLMCINLEKGLIGEVTDDNKINWSNTVLNLDPLRLDNAYLPIAFIYASGSLIHLISVDFTSNSLGYKMLSIDINTGENKLKSL